MAGDAGYEGVCSGHGQGGSLGGEEDAGAVRRMIYETDYEGRVKTMLNLFPRVDGGVERIDLPVNAVLTQIVRDVDSDGNTFYRTMTSMIVTDDEMREKVEELARDLMRAR